MSISEYNELVHWARANLGYVLLGAEYDPKSAPKEYESTPAGLASLFGSIGG